LRTTRRRSRRKTAVAVPPASRPARPAQGAAALQTCCGLFGHTIHAGYPCWVPKRRSGSLEELLFTAGAICGAGGGKLTTWHAGVKLPVADTANRVLLGAAGSQLPLLFMGLEILLMCSCPASTEHRVLHCWGSAQCPTQGHVAVASGSTSVCSGK
jgi:hypothetical protein